jgi:hypothetical protein
MNLRGSLAFCWLALVLITAPAAAQATAGRVHRLTVLGGSTAFHRPPLESLGDLQRMFQDPTIAADIRAILSSRQVSAKAVDELFHAVADGRVTPTPFAVGSRLRWMAMRERQTHQPAIVDNVEWAGKEPFDAFWIPVSDGTTEYVFVVPKKCGNLSLYDITRVPEPVCAVVTVSTVCGPQGGDANATLAASGQARSAIARIVARSSGGDEIVLTPQDLTQSKRIPPGPISISQYGADGKLIPACGATSEAPRCPPPPDEHPPSCTVNVTASQTRDGWNLTTSTTTDEPREVAFTWEGPGVPPTPFTGDTTVPVTSPGVYRFVGHAKGGTSSAATCSAEIEVTTQEKPDVSTDWFVSFLGGKERRIRPDFTSGRCAPLAAIKGGYVFHIDESNDVAVSTGVAFNTRDYDHTSVFAELEYLRHRGRLFVGTGGGVWDVTHGGTVTGTWLAHVGVGLLKPSAGTTASQGQLYFVVEGRAFLDNVTELSSSYQFWAGFRWSPSDRRR